LALAVDVVLTTVDVDVACVVDERVEGVEVGQWEIFREICDAIYDDVVF
jgi:hypothetical protein